MLMRAGAVQGLVGAWVEACILFVYMLRTNITPGTNVNEGEDNQKVWTGKKNPIDPGYDLAYGMYVTPLQPDTP